MNHVAVWTGSEMIVWGGSADTERFYDGARYDPRADRWTPMADEGAPHMCPLAAFWTGSEMLVWGDRIADGWRQAVGGLYDPATDAWRPVTDVGAPTASGAGLPVTVWNGLEMLVFGRALSSSDKVTARYDPATDTWRAMSERGAPEPLTAQGATWTGEEMVVLGGLPPDRCLGFGSAGAAVPAEARSNSARYDPGRDTWRPVAQDGAPPPSQGPAVVWTGAEVFVWGGGDCAAPIPPPDGGLYDPETDTWRPLPAGSPAEGRQLFGDALWTGTEVLVWGGLGVDGLLDTGWRYDPRREQWRAIPGEGAPLKRLWHTAVWTGSEMIVWGGESHGDRWSDAVRLDTGGRYRPGVD